MFRKRIMIAVMALSMLILVMSNAVFADSQLTVTAGKTEINKGTTTASVTLSLSNNPGIAGMSFKIGYNSDVMTLESSDMAYDVFSAADAEIIVTAINSCSYLAAATTDKTGNGLLATLNFKVNADCPEGTYDITLSNGDVCNVAYDSIEVSLVNGSITVKEYNPFEGKVAKVVAKDGTETGYESLDAAFGAAADGDTVQLLSDVTITEATGVNGKAITVDGGSNKYTITLAADTDSKNEKWTYLFAAGTGGGITFKNVNITSAADVASHTWAAVIAQTGANITLDTGAVIKDYVGGNGGALFCEGSASTLVMKAGSEIRNCKSNYRAAVGVDSGTFTMEGGTITGCAAASTSIPSAIQCGYNSSATVNLNGGEITGNTGGVGAVGAAVGTVNVKAGAKVTNNGDINIKKMTEDATINAVEGTVTGNVSAVDTLWVDDKYSAMNWTTGTLYDEVWKAVYNGWSGATVYLLKDATFKTPTADEVNANGGDSISRDKPNLDKGQNIVFDGQGHTLYMTGAKTCAATLTFKNVNMDITGSTYADNGAFRWWGGTLTFGDKCTVVGKEYTKDDINAGNPGGYLLYLGGGTVNIEEGCVIRDNKRYPSDKDSSDISGKYSVVCGAILIDGGTLNMKGGIITGCRAVEGGAIRVAKGTFNMTGGEITGNLSWSGSGIRAYADAVLNISGDSKVYGNFEGTTNAATTPDNIRANTGTSLNIDGEFTGKIGFKFNTAANNVLNAKIGTIADGLTLESVDSVVCDKDTTLFAYVSGTDLILTKKLTLTAETDKGMYKKSADKGTENDGKVYGVVRVNTTVTEVPLAESIEEIGTYFYVGASDPGVVVEETKSNCFKPEITKLAKEMGYTADLVDIEGETATVYAVNFYKLNGINGYVFEAPVPVAYAQAEAEAKDLGTDPEQLVGYWAVSEV